MNYSDEYYHFRCFDLHVQLGSVFFCLPLFIKIIIYLFKLFIYLSCIFIYLCTWRSENALLTWTEISKQQKWRYSSEKSIELLDDILQMFVSRRPLQFTASAVKEIKVVCLIKYYIMRNNSIWAETSKCLTSCQ